MGFTARSKTTSRLFFLLLVTISATVFVAPVRANVIVVENTGGLGIIKGVVRDDGGSPIGDATVAIFRNGSSKILKQVSSATDGSFIAKIVPGTYTILAVAQGFNPVTLFGVEVGRSAELNYGFKLERAGGGNTLPEKRLDRSSSKWRVRANQSQRSIYQNREGDSPVAVEEIAEANANDDRPSGYRGQTVIETYFAGSKAGNFSGVNFATLVPFSTKAQVVFAGQIGRGKAAPVRLETAAAFRPMDDHQMRLAASVAKLGEFTRVPEKRSLGQVSFQAIDEWKVRDGVILVLGIDYSKFVGAGNDSSLSPRIGFQYDIDARTRFRTAFTTQTEEKNWANAIELEGQTLAFAEPVSMDDFVVVDDRPRMNKSRRLEFGIERGLDNDSSIEANVFLDTTLSRGVGLNSLSFDALDGNAFSDLVADQQGKASGIRVVYSRRLSSKLSTGVGYAFGNGQKLSPAGITDPANVFENDFFHSFFAELAADLKTGTHVKTVFRLSPQATVFAIDPFRGRLAIYDPGMSVLVTQSIPTLGLPFRAEAIVDARNIFDFQTGIFGSDEGSLRSTAHGRMVRGGIQVRF